DFVGSGLLDESEVEGMNGSTVEMKSDLIDSYVPPPPAPVPSSAPATEVVETLPDCVFDPNPPFEVKPKAPEPATTDWAATGAHDAVCNKPETSTSQTIGEAEAKPTQTMDQITARLN